MRRAQRALQRAHRAVGVTDDVNFLTNGVDDRGDVSELGLDRVRLGIGARTATATIDCISGPSGRELRDDRRPPRVIGRRAVHKHDRRPVSGDMADDHRAIRRFDALELAAHAVTLPCARSAFKHWRFARGAGVAAGAEKTPAPDDARASRHRAAGTRRETRTSS